MQERLSALVRRVGMTGFKDHDMKKRDDAVDESGAPPGPHDPSPSRRGAARAATAAGSRAVGLQSLGSVWLRVHFALTLQLFAVYCAPARCCILLSGFVSRASLCVKPLMHLGLSQQMLLLRGTGRVDGLVFCQAKPSCATVYTSIEVVARDKLPHGVAALRCG